MARSIPRRSPRLRKVLELRVDIAGLTLARVQHYTVPSRMKSVWVVWAKSGRTSIVNGLKNLGYYVRPKFKAKPSLGKKTSNKLKYVSRPNDASAPWHCISNIGPPRVRR